jgi:hypothetical protein
MARSSTAPTSAVRRPPSRSTASFRGWTEGLQLMTVGDKVTFWIPAELAYGEQGQGPVPGNAGAELRCRAARHRRRPAVTCQQAAHGGAASGCALPSSAFQRRIASHERNACAAARSSRRPRLGRRDASQSLQCPARRACGRDCRRQRRAPGEGARRAQGAVRLCRLAGAD